MDGAGTFLTIVLTLFAVGFLIGAFACGMAQVEGSVRQALDNYSDDPGKALAAVRGVVGWDTVINDEDETTEQAIAKAST